MAPRCTRDQPHCHSVVWILGDDGHAVNAVASAQSQTTYRLKGEENSAYGQAIIKYMSHYERLCKVGWVLRGIVFILFPHQLQIHISTVLLVFTATISVKLHQLYLAQPILNRRQTFKDPFIWIDYMVQTMEAEMLNRVIGCFSPWLLNLYVCFCFQRLYMKCEDIGFGYLNQYLHCAYCTS